MKKPVQKLTLHRETVARLEVALRQVAGGDSEFDCTVKCVSGPLYECIGTLEASCHC